MKILVFTLLLTFGYTKIALASNLDIISYALATQEARLELQDKQIANISFYQTSRWQYVVVVNTIATAKHTLPCISHIKVSTPGGLAKEVRVETLCHPNL